MFPVYETGAWVAGWAHVGTGAWVTGWVRVGTGEKVCKKYVTGYATLFSFFRAIIHHWANLDNHSILKEDLFILAGSLRARAYTSYVSCCHCKAKTWNKVTSLSTCSTHESMSSWVLQPTSCLVRWVMHRTQNIAVSSHYLTLSSSYLAKSSPYLALMWS